MGSKQTESETLRPERFAWNAGDIIIERPKVNEAARSNIEIDWDRRDVPLPADGEQDGQVTADVNRADGTGYNPNRAHNGKFAPGPHHERDRIERMRVEATETARVQGHADFVARGEREAK